MQNESSQLAVETLGKKASEETPAPGAPLETPPTRRGMPLRRHPRIWLIVFMAPVALVVYWLMTLPAGVTVVRPKERLVVESIAASGQVRGEVESNIGSQSGGRVTTLFVREGSRVSQGQLLARLDSTLLKTQVQQAMAALETAQAQLLQVSRPALPSEIERARADTKQAVLVAGHRLDQARQKLRELQQGPTTEERQQVKGQWLQARAQLVQARLDLNRQQHLYAGGTVPRAEYDRAISTEQVAVEEFKRTQTQYQQAQRDLKQQQELFRTSSRADLDRTTNALTVASEEVDQAKAQLEQSKLDLARLQRLFDGGAVPRAELDRANSSTRIASNTLQQATARLAQARLDQKRQEQLFEEGTIPRADVERAETAVAVSKRALSQADYRLQQARRDLKVQQQSYGINRRADLDRAQNAFRTAQGVLETAQAKLRQTEIGSRVEDIAQAKADVMAAQATLDGVQRSGELQLQTLLAQPREEDVYLAQARVEEAREAIAVAQRRLEEVDVTAPFDGIVTSILTETGGVIGPNLPLLRLVRRGVPDIRVNIDENNLGRLHVGQQAIITSDAFTGQRFTARVRELGAQIDSQTGTIEVRLTPINPPRWLRPGQTLSVNVIVDPGSHRLTVPLTAVATVGNHSTVLVLRNGRALRQEVKVSSAGLNYVPILAGLSPQDLVIIGPTGIIPSQRVRATTIESFP